MGHLVGKDLYRELGRKIDGLSFRTPWNDKLYALLKELYSEDDAQLIVKMPYGLSKIDHLERVVGIPRVDLERQLESVCARGLVMDICVQGEYFYAPSPFIIGIFEFTMMRAGADADPKKWAPLFRDYLAGGECFEANLGAGQQVSLMRAVPHDGSIPPEEFVEVLDYEKATELVETAGRFSMGLCSCRHEKHHTGEKKCKAPLDNCSSFGTISTDYLVRHNLAREVSKTEMLENIARSRELGLVLNAENIRRNVNFMCHCCGCCCHALGAINGHGYPNAVVTSNYIASSNRELCKGCGTCSRRCPVSAIPREGDADPRFRKHGRPKVDEALCIGCGVCAVKCKSGAMRLHPRKRRVFHPETMFERTILGCLERGTLQNQLFDDPTKKSHQFLRGVVGGFLRLDPVKRALMSDALRSRFLDAIRGATELAGKARLTEI